MFFGMFLGPSQNWQIFRGHFRVLFEGQGTEWRMFLGLLKVQIFIWGA